MGIMEGSILGFIKGDARSLDYSSCVYKNSFPTLNVSPAHKTFRSLIWSATTARKFPYWCYGGSGDDLKP